MLLAPLVAVEDGLGELNYLGVVVVEAGDVEAGDAVGDHIPETNMGTVVSVHFGVGPNAGVEGGDFLLSHVQLQVVVGVSHRALPLLLALVEPLLVFAAEVFGELLFAANLRQ